MPSIIIDGTTYNLPADEFQAQKVTAYNTALLALAAPWTAYVPTITVGSGAITTLGTVSARYKQIGKTVFFQVSIAITTNGSAANHVSASLPFPAAAFEFLVPGIEISATGDLLRGYIAASATSVQIRKYDDTYPGGDLYRLVVSGTYEIA